MNKKTVRLIGLGLIVFFTTCPVKLLAQSSTGETPPLPEPDEQSEPLYITDSNVSLYHDLLLAPVASWVKKRKMLLRAVSRLPYSFGYSPLWEEQTSANIGAYEIAENGALKYLGQGEPLGGFPFGDATEINRTVDPEVRAEKILWNVFFAEGSVPHKLYSVDLAWLGARDVLRTARGKYFRTFNLKESLKPTIELPSPVEEAAEQPMPETEEEVPGASAEEVDEAVASVPPAVPARRDILELYYPPVVFGYRQLAWRHFNNTADSMWIHSPVIGRTRELLESNRGDSLLGGIMSFDDFFIWSGRNESYAVKVVEEKVLLLPFPSLRVSAVEKKRISQSLEGDEENKSSEMAMTVEGSHSTLDNESSAVLWNYQTKQLVEYAPWLPVTTYFVPRKVWIIEALTKDPYYASGSQLLVVDQESMLPVVKIVYSRRGNYKRIVMGMWGLAAEEEGSVQFPYLAGLFALDVQGNEAMTVSTSSVSVFTSNDSGSVAAWQEKLLAPDTSVDSE